MWSRSTFSKKNKNETPFETGGVTEGYYVKLLGRISFPESERVENIR